MEIFGELTSVRESEEIDSISKFIEEIEKVTNKFKFENSNFIFAYRGENEKYKNPCMPSIFRDEYLNQQKNFEINILNEIKARGLSDKNELILRAIDAQHNGFPTRLLDITFDPLVALYFAVSDVSDASENKNAQFFIFAIESLDLVTDKDINELYKKSIENTEKRNFNIFNQRFLDFSSVNSRIQAQKGGFILFPGNEFFPLPQKIQKKFIIKSEYKQKLLNDLDSIFGINESKIYPEINNFVSSLRNRTKNHLNYSDIDNIKNNLSIYLSQLYSNARTLLLRTDRSENEILKCINMYVKFINMLDVICFDMKKETNDESDIELFIGQVKIKFERLFERYGYKIKNDNYNCYLGNFYGQKFINK